MQKLEYVDLVAPDGTTYNDLPKGWRSISEKEFVQGKFLSYSPELVEHRQMWSDPDDPNRHMKAVITATLYWFFDGTGIAISSDWWAGKLQFYAFGCEHSYRELSQEECHNRNIYSGGQCYHVSECAKCKHINAVDSSD